MITTIEIIYIAVAAVLFLYSAGLTIALCIMASRTRRKALETDIRIQKNANMIDAAEKKLDSGMEAVDKQIAEMEEATDIKIKSMGEEVMSSATHLIEQKSADVAGRMNEISARLNIMDSTVKNLEKEKIFLQGMIMGKEEKEGIEAEYTELPDGITAGAKRAVENIADKGKRFATEYYPLIRKKAPDIVGAALKFVKDRRNRKDSNKE